MKARSRTTPLVSFLGQSDALARLQEHAGRLLRLQRKLDAALPAAVSGAAMVANFQDGELTLHVISPAMSTRLRLSQESIKRSLLMAGEAVSTIKVKVRASPFRGNHQPEELAPRPIGRGGREALQALADSLREDDPLARSLRRVIDRCAKG